MRRQLIKKKSDEMLYFFPIFYYTLILRFLLILMRCSIPTIRLRWQEFFISCAHVDIDIVLLRRLKYQEPPISSSRAFHPSYICNPPINRQPNPQPSFTNSTLSNQFTHPLKQTHRQPGPRIDDQRRARDIRRRRTAQELNGVGYLVGLRHALQWHDGLDHVLEVWVEGCFLRVHGAGYPGWTDGVDADAVGGVVDCCLGGGGGWFCSLVQIVENYEQYM